MGYQDELDRLQKIIVSDGYKKEQREEARKVKRRLLDDAIKGIFEEFEEHTSTYANLLERLKGIVDKIHNNTLTGVISEVDKLTDIVASNENRGADPGS